MKLFKKSILFTVFFFGLLFTFSINNSGIQSAQAWDVSFCWNYKTNQIMDPGSHPSWQTINSPCGPGATYQVKKFASDPGICQHDPNAHEVHADCAGPTPTPVLNVAQKTQQALQQDPIFTSSNNPWTVDDHYCLDASSDPTDNNVITRKLNGKDVKCITDDYNTINIAKNGHIKFYIYGIPDPSTHSIMSDQEIFYDIELQDRTKNYIRSAYARLTFSDTDCQVGNTEGMAKSDWNPTCTQQGNKSWIFSGSIPENKLFNQDSAISRSFKLVIRIGAHPDNAIIDPDNTYFKPKDGFIRNFQVQAVKDRHTCFVASFQADSNNNSWALAGDKMNLVINHAIEGYDNSQYKNGKCNLGTGAHPSADNPAIFRYGIITGSNNSETNDNLQQFTCTEDTCILPYTIPANIDRDEVKIEVAAGENGKSDNPDGFINGTNVYELPQTLEIDRNWAAIIDQDNNQNGMALRCNQNMQIPNCSDADEVIADDEPLACHGNSNYPNPPGNTYVCPNSDEFSCYKKIDSGQYKGQWHRYCAKLKDGYTQICASDQIYKDAYGQVHCDGIASPLGVIPTEPEALVTKIFGVLLSLAGGIALFLIMLSGYRIMVSQGKPEAIQAARDQLTSAITGLLFIIFSMIIFEVITRDILHIPGIN